MQWPGKRREGAASNQQLFQEAEVGEHADNHEDRCAVPHSVATAAGGRGGGIGLMLSLNGWMVMEAAQGDGEVEHLLAADVAGAVALDAEPLDGASPVRQGQFTLAAALQLEHRLFRQRHHADAAHRFLRRNVFCRRFLLPGCSSGACLRLRNKWHQSEAEHSSRGRAEGAGVRYSPQPFCHLEQPAARRHGLGAAYLLQLLLLLLGGAAVTLGDHQERDGLGGGGEENS